MPENWEQVCTDVRFLRGAVFAKADGMTRQDCWIELTKANAHLAYCRLHGGDLSQVAADAQVQAGAWDDVTWWLSTHGKDVFIKTEWEQAGLLKRITARLRRTTNGGEA